MINFDHIKKTFIPARNCSTAVACIWSLIRFNEGDTTPWILTEWSKTEKGMTNMSGLLDAVRRSGFEAIARRLTMEQLKIQVFPIIIFVEKDDGVKDYVICYGFDGARFIIGDTSWGLNQYWPDEIKAMWIGGITLDLFPGNRFVGGEQYREGLRKFVSDLIRQKTEERKLLLNSWIERSACDVGKDVLWLNRIFPRFYRWCLFMVLLWLGGIGYSIYQEMYWSLCGWGCILFLCWGMYKLGVHWRESLGAHNWGRLKKEKEEVSEKKDPAELDMEEGMPGRADVWNWRVQQCSVWLSVLVGLCAWPDVWLGVGLGLITFSCMNMAFTYIRMAEITHTLYWISIELHNEEESS